MDFEALYDEFAGRIFQLAYRLLKDKDMAVDATSETFAKAFAARESFRGQAKPSTWLYRIAYNHCLNRLSAIKRAREVPLDVENLRRPRSESPSGRPEMLRQALDSLSEDDRRLLCLMLDEGLDYPGAAEILGVSEEALRMRVCRARRRLKAILEPLLEEEL